MHSTPSIGLGRALLGVGAVVTVLFTVLDPSPSNGLLVLDRLLFWALHAFGGLAALVVAQRWVDRGSVLRRRPWLAVLVGGAVGALLFAPLAMAFEGLFDLPADDPGDLPGATAPGWPSVLIEAGELAPALVTTWIVVQLPWLLRLDFRRPGIPKAGTAPVDSEEKADKAEPAQPPVEAPGGPAVDPPDDGKETLTDGLLAQLPPALGSDIVALGSELHYLRVRTTLGEALVLFNLKDAVAELEKHIDGLSVHRSHWVARAHVRQLVRRGSGWACVMSAGEPVPISRRRATEVRALFGDAARYGDVADKS